MFNSAIGLTPEENVATMSPSLTSTVNGGPTGTPGRLEGNHRVSKSLLVGTITGVLSVIIGVIILAIIRQRRRRTAARVGPDSDGTGAPNNISHSVDPFPSMSHPTGMLIL